jgi:hypothetical protein
MFLVRFIFSALLLLSTLVSQAQLAADTIIILPLGKTMFCPVRVDQGIKNVEPGFGHLHFILENDHVVSLPALGYEDLEIPVIADSIESIQTGFLHSVFIYKDKSIDQFFAAELHDIVYPFDLKAVRSVTCGPNFSAVVKESNMMYSWGKKGVLKDLQIPTKVGGIKSAAAGESHLAFIDLHNKVHVWGDSSEGKGAVPEFKGDPLQVVAGYDHTLVLDSKKRVYAWGKNQEEAVRKVGKIKGLDAHGDYSVVVTKKNEVLLWGAGLDLRFSVSSIGEVSFAQLGPDYLVLGLQKNDQGGQKASESFGLAIAEIDSMRVKAHPKLENKKSYAGNNQIISNSSNTKHLGDGSSQSTISFEGENNTIRIINQDLVTNNRNNKQKIIIKGSNKDVTFKSAGRYSSLSNDTSTVVIDLDNYAPRPTVSVVRGRSYSSNRVYVPGRYTKPKPVKTYESKSIEYDAIVEVFAGDSKYYSLELDNYPISDGIWQLGEYWIKDVDDKEHLKDEAGYLSSGVSQAQIYFYLNMPQKGINSLLEGGEENFQAESYLALYEVYYSGLFGVNEDKEKAAKYLKLYEQNKW